MIRPLEGRPYDFKHHLFPICKVRVVKYNECCPLLSFPPRPPLLAFSSTSTRSQWAPPDLNHELSGHHFEHARSCKETWNFEGWFDPKLHNATCVPPKTQTRGFVGIHGVTFSCAPLPIAHANVAFLNPTTVVFVASISRCVHGKSSKHTYTRYTPMNR